MSQRRLILTIQRLAETAEALTQLQRLSPAEIDQMIRILSDPAAVHALRQVLRAAQGAKPSHRHSDRTRRNEQKAAEIKHLREVLETLFQDRDRFPSVASIAKFVKQVFRLSVPYEKQSRARYVGNLARSIAKNPRTMSYARRNLLEADSSDKDDAYKILYEFIRGSLRESE